MSEHEKKSKNDHSADKAYKAASCIFIGIISVAGLYLLLAPRPTVSETEKRELEKFPVLTAESYFSGEFAQALDRYYTDTVPDRDILNEAAAALEKARGIAAPQFYGNVSVVNEEPEEPEIELPEETEIITEQTVTEPPVNVTEEAVSEEASETEAPQTEPALSETVKEAESTVTEPAETEPEEEEFNGNINEFLNNGILVDGVKMYGEKAGIMLFGGNKAAGLKYAQTINSYKEALGSDINVYDIVVPTSVEFYLPKKFAKYSASEKDAIQYIYDNLSEDIITVDAYSVLEEHKDEYIYFRTDHHWTDLGAYYAYTAFADALGQEPPPLSDYEMRQKQEGFVGSLYSYTGDITLKNNPDTFTYFIPPNDFRAEAFRYKDLASLGPTKLFHEYASGVNMYGMFLGGDNMHIKATSDAGTGRKAVVFKESYGNAFSPYLVSSFDEVYVIDIRYFGTNAVDYIKKVGATDVIFVNNIFAANTPMLVDNIGKLYSSPSGVS